MHVILYETLAKMQANSNQKSFFLKKNKEKIN